MTATSYMTVLRAVRAGAQTSREVATATGLHPYRAAAFLEYLERNGRVERLGKLPHGGGRPMVLWGPAKLVGAR
jgi:DNA-binding IclR family transcriptional regulator